MFNSKLTKNSLEILEARIAPANASGAALPTEQNEFVKATLGAPVLVTAGQVLNTTGVANDGAYLLYVEKGSALVFFTDLNGNSEVDYNEITGISAGDGLRMVCFTDIHGDVVTNLRETKVTFPGSGGTAIQRTVISLSDSDSNPANDPIATRGDGRVLLDSTIEKIEMRSLRPTDVGDQNHDGAIDDLDVAARRIQSTYSIFGNIYAGGGFGAADGGLIIDATGGSNYGFEIIPTFGTIKVGTAASGEFFSFGSSRADDASGTLSTFTPGRGVAGGSIIGVHAVDPTLRFVINGLYAGDGGFGAKGGDIKDIVLNGDDSGGYEIIAGRGGAGLSGGSGGSIMNFSDLGSSTSKVVIRSGDGGVGSTGAGGAGGEFSFETFNVRGNVAIELGNGGDGFSKGGDGASLAKGLFTQPDVSTFTPGNGYGTTHLPSAYNPNSTPDQGMWVGSYQARFGTHEAIDFDGDGYGDFVYTTRGTSQLVVMFGDGAGGFRYMQGPDGLLVPDRIYLSGVRNAEALTVGDFNGDGRPDIAVASIDEGSHAGIVTFLSKYEHEGLDAPNGSEDLNGNGKNDFLGFTTGRFSALPLLPADYAEAPVQVSSLAAGDFDGDGRTELAVVATYYVTEISNAGVVVGVDTPNQVLIFMTGDTEVDNLTGNPKMTGTFYADFGTKGSLSEPAVPRVPWAVLSTTSSPGGGRPETVVIEATALSNTSKFDVVLAGLVDGKGVTSIAFGAADGNGGVQQLAAPTVMGTYALGRVDTNRQTGANDITQTDFLLKDFTAFDFDDDGNVDIAAISNSPEGFMVGVQGTGTGGGSQVSGDGGQNSGNWFGGLDGYDIGTTLHAIKSVDADGDGKINDLAVFHNSGPDATIALIKFQTGPQASPLLLDAATGARAGSGPFFFDPHYSDATDLSLPGFGNSSLSGANAIYFNGGSFATEPLFEVGLKILAGDGGDSSVGNGGKGGSLGAGAKLVDLIDPTTGVTYKDLQGSLNFILSGDLRLFAGAGGNGFANGGAGGDVTGVTLRYRDGSSPGPGLGASLAAGDGGRGVTGKGGVGGSINNVSIQTSVAVNPFQPATSMPDQVFLEAGNGGAGAIGGKGGSVYGNKTIIADAITSYLDVRGGQGGAGIKRGGDGGTVQDLSPILRLPIVPVDGAGSVYYLGGDGGSAVSGRGGNGGSVLDSSPRINAFLSGEVYLRGGDAGSGTTGGNGGTVRDFKVTIVSKETQSFTAIAGHGGSGSVGNGGNGGSVIDITVPSRGVVADQPLTNRVLAGNGGASAGAKGGNGGSLVMINSSAQDGSFALVGGAGGAGLTQGGKGGSIVKNTVSIGSGAQAKVLVAAGAGGDATAFLPNKFESSAEQDLAALNAFGGKIGRGGAGGEISGFTQLGSTGAHVDLIGGNGGSTLNYGSVLDDGTPFVGRGGSIKNIFLRGDIGNVQADRANTAVDENVPIKSYNNIYAGQTMASYVEDMLRNSGPATSLTDADGNVGVVVGAAGRNKATAGLANPDVYTSQPANNSINGSLINVTASNLMSAVAGNVDRIAAIQVIRGLKILGGQIGADKGSYVAPRLDPELPGVDGSHKGSGKIGEFDYLLQDGDTLTPRDPVRDGALIDGAVFALSIVDDAGRPIKLAGRVYDI